MSRGASSFWRERWLLWSLPALLTLAWVVYVWSLARNDADAPLVPFIYDL